MNRKLLLVAFMISGMTALIYEVVWSRPLQLIFGSTIYTASTILTTFFIGFALGSYLFRNLADTKNPIKLFSFLQIGIGGYGLILLYAFKLLPSIYLNLPDYTFVRFLLVFLVLIIPTTLFGATWPAVYKAYSNEETFGKDSGVLYSFNSFGSFIGSIGAGFFVLPLFGVTKTILLSAGVNIFVGVLIYSIYQKGKNEN